jgi:ubiquinol-cytochrome c reductase iron-sulfur subunit
MAEPPSPPPRRRDLLTSSALVLSAGGLLATLWPLLSAMQPDAETQARQQIFSTGRLAETGQALLTFQGTPVLIFRRSPAELEALTKAAPADPSHRAQRPGIMVVSARCPSDACTVVRNEGYTGALLRCPCCASTFDLAGRRTAGRAQRDLDIPPYRFLSDFEIEIGQR